MKAAVGQVRTLKPIAAEPDPYPERIRVNKGDTLQPNKIVITTKNALRMFLEPKFHNEVQKLLKTKEYWHKFRVMNTTLENKELVLRLILQFLHPLGFIPVLIRCDGDNLFFLSRSCGPAIEKLCRANLTLILSNFKIVMEIMLGFSNIEEISFSTQDTVRKALDARFNKLKRHLDLSNFHEDPVLVDSVFCPLSYNRTLNYVVNCAVTNFKPIKSISIGNNGITTLEYFEKCRILRTMTSLDLSCNLIKEVNELRHLKYPNLLELTVDKNPMCEHYKDQFSYIVEVTKLVPSLKKLDGIVLPEEGFLPFRRNYVSSPEDIPLADQFVHHYISLYDCGDRRKMEGLYHGRALFSLSTTCGYGQNTSSSARLTEYSTHSRNLLKLTDYSKSMNVLHYGSMTIMEEICKLPKTEHDPYSLKVDLIRCGPGVVISMSGIFKESSGFMLPPMRSFYRVFVLIKTGAKTFQIANDTLHITNPTPKEVEEAFKFPLPPKKLAEDTGGDYRKYQMIDMLCELTMMNRKWSKQCLEETNWSIKEALYIFTELYKIGKVPEDAFTEVKA